MIGTLLGLPKGRLDIIEHDNYHKARPCYDAVLGEWLEVDPFASWEKLLEVIESLAVSNDQAPHKGDLCVYRVSSLNVYFYRTLHIV